MIVNKSGEKWEIIFHRAHALLAAEIAFKIHPYLYPPQVPFIELITAIADHDDGRIKWQGDEHIDNDGGPLDYKKQSLDVQIKQAQNSINNASYRSPWACLLTSLHHSFIYKSFAEEPKIRKFLEKQRKEQDRLMEFLKIQRSEADRVYQFMLLCDELSLILCEGKIEVRKPTEQIKLTPDISDFTITRINKKYSTIVPWCFRDSRCNLSVNSYKIPLKKYRNDGELLKAVRVAGPVRKIWNFIKTSN